MFNLLLAVEFLLYILTILLGFKIQRNHKGDLNKKYKQYKSGLYVLISMIFFASEYILIKTAIVSSWVWYLFALNTLFIIYFYSFTFRETRCWKQHRMIFYNFFLIPVIFACSVILETKALNYLVIVISFYNVLEFQFAKFNPKRIMLWD